MNQKKEAPLYPPCSTESRTTVVYGKWFAVVGLFCGMAMVLNTPAIFMALHEGMGVSTRNWVESMPDWTVPVALCIGMGGGVLVALVSACFGLLIPSRVIRD